MIQAGGTNIPVLTIPRLFTHQECDDLSGAMKKYATKEEAAVYTDQTYGIDTTPEFRKGSVYSRTVNNYKSEFITHMQTDRLNYAIQKFHLDTGIRSIVTPGVFEFQLAVYDQADDHFKIHRDASPDLGRWADENLKTVRKISMSIPLSNTQEYEGCGLRFETKEKQTVRVQADKGDAVIFPSWLMHQVDPLISGTRESLVVWAHGDFWI
jgi:predicted 2-oxoglutarate/Fe(II)-dependent dioxygenase YbiX|tara:strand:- start:2733 stop:3362 length:630 start_codon:yes stop_codon:yes gene_type:complete